MSEYKLNDVLLGIAVSCVVSIALSVAATALFFKYGEKRRNARAYTSQRLESAATFPDKLDCVVVETYEPDGHSSGTSENMKYVSRDLNEKLEFNISQRPTGEFIIKDVSACPRLQPEVIQGDELVSCVIDFTGFALPLATAILQSASCNISQLCIRKRPPAKVNIPTITITDCSSKEAKLKNTNSDASLVNDNQTKRRGSQSTENGTSSKKSSSTNKKTKNDRS